jgi:AcrR family transcriptional regulator
MITDDRVEFLMTESGGDGRARVRMSGRQRREQLLDVGRSLFAEKGFEATSIEEIASRAGVSKPLVYEHFGGKEGLYAVVVDREMGTLLDRLTAAMSAGHPRQLVERAALALLTYIEEQTDGFRILARDSPATGSSGTFSSLLNDIASQAEHLMAREFAARGMDIDLAPIYAQMLVGMVALTGLWWLEERHPPRDVVAAHLVNLAWNGLHNLEHAPVLRADRD